MQMDNALLELICCPETHQPLQIADAETLAEINRRIAGGVATTGGRAITAPLEEALVREDRRVAYAITGGIPVLLAEEGIPLA